ncbi:MAG: Serine hydroxymethyltransferase [Microgenomates bacterium OLB22]|nr:MAG: Serine hydroxymethyltransferase [Microgenomates bacterium OLB22]
MSQKDFRSLHYLQQQDPTVFDIWKKEVARQKYGIELIASENYVSPAVLEALGSEFTNKYSEGLPGRRYYGGNEYIDEVETLAIERAKELFKSEHVNVQPHSGNPANMAAYFALLNPGDTILGMSLAHGGHLSHGMPLNFSGKWYKVIGYETDPQTGLIDIDQVRALAKEHKPKLILAGFSAYSRSLNWQLFREIADEVGAYLMADIAHIAGLIAGNQLDSPIPHCDIVTTTTHKTLRGPRGAIIMSREDLGMRIDKAVFPGLQGGPHEHTIAAKAVAFQEALQPSFSIYAEQIIKNAQALSTALQYAGFNIVSGGTDNHLMLVDLRPKRITGDVAERALELAGISANKNLIPFDPEKPIVTSGIRLGTPAMTTRGMKEEEMKTVAAFVTQALEHHANEKKLQEIKREIHHFTAQFPMFSE